jgi:hypothetical protein
VEYAIRLLAEAGAELPASRNPDELCAWLRKWKMRLCRTVSHCGNHKYAWSLNRRVSLPPGQPYPKQIDR